MQSGGAGSLGEWDPCDEFNDQCGDGLMCQYEFMGDENLCMGMGHDHSYCEETPPECLTELADIPLDNHMEYMTVLCAETLDTSTCSADVIEFEVAQQLECHCGMGMGMDMGMGPAGEPYDPGMGMDMGMGPAGEPFNSDMNMDAGQCDLSAALDVLPSTCSVASMQGGDGCSFQLPLAGVLGTPDLYLQVAVSKCPRTLMPFISVRMGGAGADNLLAPCASDDDCSAGHTCFDFAAVTVGLREDESVWDNLVHDVLFNLIQSNEDEEALHAAVEAQNFGSTMLTTLRKYYDSQNIDLAPTGQLFPMCMPSGGDDAVFDWDPAGGVCETAWDWTEGETDDGDPIWASPYCSDMQDQEGCVLLEGCEFNSDWWQCQSTDPNSGYSTVDPNDVRAQCNEIQDKDQCRGPRDYPPGLCDFKRNGGVFASEEKTFGLLDVPLAESTTDFELDGVSYTCPEYICEEDGDFPWDGNCLPITEYSDQNGARVKCVSSHAHAPHTHSGVSFLPSICFTVLIHAVIAHCR